MPVMLISRRGFHAFSEYDLRANLDKFLAEVRSQIESDSEIGTKEEEPYVKELVADRTWEPLAFDVEKISVTQREVQIPGNYFPGNYWVERGHSYPKPVVTFHLPFTGQEQLLHCRGSTFLSVSDDIAVENGQILFEVINFNNDAEAVKRERDQVLKRLTDTAGYVNADVNAYNAKLEGVVRESIQRAKAKFKGQADFLSSLGNKPAGSD